MTTVDIALGLVLLYGAWQGWSKGFFCRCARWIGLWLGLWAACVCAARGGCLLSAYTGWGEGMSLLAAFVLIWMAVAVALGVVARLLTAVTEWLGLNGLNRLAGALAGVLIYVVGLSLLITVVEWGGLRSGRLCERSVLYPPLKSAAAYTCDGCRKMVVRVVDGTLKRADGTEAQGEAGEP
ncbi:MAG: CvpA family protein [Clostridium sp.]|nr:CvpA family protein [Clostridium sp.]